MDLNSDTYSVATGLAYVFNINVGTGILALPYAFKHTGWLLSAVTLTVVCLCSYLTFAFVIESMSIANAIIKINNKHSSRRRSSPIADRSSSSEIEEQHSDETEGSRRTVDAEGLSLLPEVSGLTRKSEGYLTFGSIDPESIYEIEEITEMGRMAKLFMNRSGIIFFYLCMCLYLYGDMIVACAAIGKALMDMSCSYVPPTCNMTVTDIDPCWYKLSISRITSYRLYNILVLITLGPFTFFNMQRSKNLQIFTSSYRVSAFILMIVLTAIAMVRGLRGGHTAVANFENIPQFFGVAVLSFVCQQALPSIVTPIHDKKHLLRLGLADFILILIFYLLICFTGIFAFRHLNDVYTSNFAGNSFCTQNNSMLPQIALFQILLPLYPVFTLGANFTINLVTLKNNLNSLCAWSSTSSHTSQYIAKFLVPLVALIPSVLIALSTTDFEFLVGIVGNYTAMSIQLLIPSMLLLSARRRLRQICENDDYSRQLLSTHNKYKLRFVNNVVVYSMLLWSVLCLFLITIKYTI